MARDFSAASFPLSGLRHNPTEGNSGWFIWSGRPEVPEADDAFVALHTHHVEDLCPLVWRLFGLPPGYRFITEPGYLDVWYDAGLVCT